MFVKRLAVLLAAVPLLAGGQTMPHSLMSSGADARSSLNTTSANADTLRILAVMVQFQTDNDARTTGNGHFVLTAGVDTSLDAPPHNAEYFRNHLRFSENYFRRVSKGKVNFAATMVDSVVTLPQQMAVYVPAKNGPNIPLGNLARDAWHAVDSLHLVQDFARYSCFVVFHAGAGHDIDLVSQLGYDPTPLDIPSLYLGLNALRQVYGQNYSGFPVQNGAFSIPNTVILPETETRSIPGITGDISLILGLNGLLCASLGSYLGLPDLFNTVTGASGIGRFGLMDGQAIFSFSGAFPPEPSAWEKYWLGWLTPIEVASGQTAVTLPAVALADTVYKIPLSSQEYFLLENRNRDPLRTGVTVTSVLNGVTRQKTYTRDVAGFFDLDISGLSGVVTDVSVPDWSVPGATADDGTFYDGGVLIWHIDEATIAAGLQNDAVNANPLRKGVRVVEADGAQDIGQSYGLLSAGSGSEQGTLFDYWYNGNTAPVYKNLISPTTIPDSKTNSGANSHVSVSAFSSRGLRMTAIIMRGDDQIAPLQGFPKRGGQLLAQQALTVAFPTAGTPLMFAAGKSTAAPKRQETELTPPTGKVFAWDVSGAPALIGGKSAGVFVQLLPGEDAGSCIVINGPGGTPEVVVPVSAADGSSASVRFYVLRDTSPRDSLADLIASVGTGRRTIVFPPVSDDSTIAVGLSGARLLILKDDGSVVDSMQVTTDTTATVTGVSRFFAGSGGGFIITCSDGTVAYTHTPIRLTTPLGSIGSSRVFEGPIAGPGICAPATPTSPAAVAFATTGGALYLTAADLSPVTGFPVSTGGAISNPPAFADVDGDGQTDIVVFSGSRICAYNRSGASLDYFPVTLSGLIASSPVVADIDGDGKPEIVAVTNDGVVAAVDRKGRMITGFPLAAGSGSQSAAVFTLPGGTGTVLAVASGDDGGVTAWKTSSSGTAVLPWPQYQYNASHSGVNPAVPAAGTPMSAEFFPKSRVYNWPNPVYNGTTFIRYYLNEDATVHIKIFDLTGDLVREVTGPGRSGLDNEVAWDVSGVQSGVYLARVEANSGSKSQVQIIKIAVVK